MDEKLLDYVKKNDIKLLQNQIENLSKNQVLINSNTQNMMNLANTRLSDELKRQFLNFDTRLRKIETKMK